MRLGRVLAVGAAGILTVAGYRYLTRDDEPVPPPILNTTGEKDNDGLLVKRRTVDYEVIVREALERRASLLTLLLKRDMVRDEHLETSIRYTPFPTSRARVRVKYHVEFPIGYLLGPHAFHVSAGAGGLTITLFRPRLIARPSVRLLSHEVLDSGYLIDEQAALLELQQRIEPEAERRTAEVLALPGVVPRSEAVLSGFLLPILTQAADGGKPPPITFQYKP